MHQQTVKDNKEPLVVKNVPTKHKTVPKNLAIHLPPPQSPVPLPQPSPVSHNNCHQMQTSPLLIQIGQSASLDSVPSTPTTLTNEGKDKAKSEKAKSEKQSTIDSASRLQIQNYLHLVSGQYKIPSIIELEHSYAKSCHVHPDTQIRAQAAKFLFMKNFPRHLNRQSNSIPSNDEDVDILSCEEQKKIPFLTPRPPSVLMTVDEDIPEIDSSITDSWTCEMNKLWTRANKIVHSDRVARLSFEGNANEVLLKRNLQEQTANKFRELFASTFWDSKLVSWLHNTLLLHLNPNYKPVYLDSLQILKHKIPSLIETFYTVKTENKTKPFLNDPLFNTLSHYKLKKLPKKPIFIMVPHAPNLSVNHSVRTKYWNSMFSSMGKVITIPTAAKESDYIVDILSDIRCFVNDKIRNSKSLFENRPIILVGFHYGSIIAAHCAIQNQKSISAIICLGFPLKGINGIRGELDDPLLETTIPMQFIIGENAVMTSLDDMEDFRERMTKTETSLIVVGGADDKLVVSNLKKRLECITQSMVDRCVADEIFVFLSDLLLKSDDSNATDSKPFSMFMSMGTPLQSPRASKPKKPSKKRPLPSTEDGATSARPMDPNAIVVKPPPKKKRAPPKPKTPVPNPEAKPGELTPMLIPISSLPPNFQPHLFPNLTAVLNGTPQEKMNLDNIRQYLSCPIKAENAKMISDPSLNILPAPSPAPKRSSKKSLGNTSLTQNIGTLPSIMEETTTSPVKSLVLDQASQSSALSALLKSSPPKGSSSQQTVSTAASVSELNLVTLSTQPVSDKSLPQVSTAAAPLLVISSASPVPSSSTPATPESSKPAPIVSPTLKDSYQISEHPLIHQSSTRTGRQIKPPKSLDI